MGATTRYTETIRKISKVSKYISILNLVLDNWLNQDFLKVHFYTFIL